MSLRRAPFAQLDPARQAQLAWRIALVAVLAAGAATGLFLYLARTGDAWQLPGVAGLSLLLTLAAAAAGWLIRHGRVLAGLWLLALTGQLVFLGAAALVSGIGLLLGLSVALLSLLVAAVALPEPHATRLQLLGLMAGALCLLVELADPAYRVPAPTAVRWAVPILLGGVLLIYTLFLVNQRRAFSLRAKITLAFLGVVLVPLALQFYVNDQASRAALTAAASRTLRTAADTTATRIENFINTNKEVLLDEAQFRALSDFLQLPPAQRANSATGSQAARLLETFRGKRGRVSALQAQYVQIQSYWLLDSDGIIVLSTEPVDIGRNLADRDFFRQAMASTLASTSVYLSPVEFSPRGAPELYFSVQVVPDGVLVARYNATVLQSVLETANGLAGQDSFAVLFDENFLRLAHGTQPDSLFKLTGPVDEARTRQLQADGRLPNRPLEQLSTNLVALERSLRLSASRPFFRAVDVATGELVNQVAVVPLISKPWQVAYFQPEAVFLAPLEAQAQTSLLLAGLIALGVTGLALVGSRVLSGPITRLTSVARQVSAGELNAQATVESADEIGALAETFNSMIAQLRDLYQDLEARVEVRTRQLAAAAEVGRAATSILNTDALLVRALELIRERFGYYHASVFLLDEAGEHAVLRESTGQVGQLLKARGYRLRVGSNSIIGWVSANQQPRVASEVGADPVHFKNELLLDTRSEAALPLLVGDRLIGVLDVQSTQADAFGPSDLETLQILADQVAVAIENGRLFGRQQRVVELEKLVAGLSAKIHQTTNIEVVLEAAATDLGRALGARRAVVRLTPPGPAVQAEPPPAVLEAPGEQGAESPDSGNGRH